MKLTEDKIKEYLKKGPENLEDYYQKKLRKIMQKYVEVKCSGEMFDHFQKELIQANSMPGMGQEVGCSQSFKADRMLHVLKNTKRDTEEYQKALLAEAETASEELLGVRRFSIVFSLIPDAWQNIFDKLYHQKKLWIEVEPESGLSHQQFVEGRKRILAYMIRMYNNESLDNMALASHKRLTMETKKRNIGIENGYRQLTFQFKQEERK